MSSFLDRDQAESILRTTLRGITSAMVDHAKASSGSEVATALEGNLIPFAEQLLPALAATVSRATLGLAVSDALKRDPALYGLVRAAGSLTLSVAEDGSINVAVGGSGN